MLALSINDEITTLIFTHHLRFLINRLLLDLSKILLNLENISIEKRYVIALSRHVNH